VTPDLSKGVGDSYKQLISLVDIIILEKAPTRHGDVSESVYFDAMTIFHRTFLKTQNHPSSGRIVKILEEISKR